MKLTKSLKCSQKISRQIFATPSRIVVSGFLLLTLIGAGLLMIPAMSGGDQISFIDALFTAISATCVTGLSVFDIKYALSILGQMTLLFLIQIGGLGIMTFSTLFVLIAGKVPRLANQELIRDTFTHGDDRSLRSIIKDIFIFTMFCELIGVLLLAAFFLYHHQGFSRAFYNSIFHAISAFCNAGFSLFSNSMMDYRENWFINLTLAFLIISGGIGFLVFSEIKSTFPFHRRAWQRFSLHTKIVVSSTLILLVFSTLAILLMEWHNTLIK